MGAHLSDLGGIAGILINLAHIFLQFSVVTACSTRFEKSIFSFRLFYCIMGEIATAFAESWLVKRGTE